MTYFSLLFTSPRRRRMEVDLREIKQMKTTCRQISDINPLSFILKTNTYQILFPTQISNQKEALLICQEYFRLNYYCR